MEKTRKNPCYLMLTGGTGTGKTHFIKSLLKRVDREQNQVVIIDECDAYASYVPSIYTQPFNDNRSYRVIPQQDFDMGAFLKNLNDSVDYLIIDHADSLFKKMSDYEQFRTLSQKGAIKHIYLVLQEQPDLSYFPSFSVVKMPDFATLPAL